MTSDEMDQLYQAMRERYKQQPDPELRHAIKALGNFLKLHRDRADQLDENDVAYIRKRHHALMS